MKHSDAAAAAMGYNYLGIGTHSIRKRDVTYLALLLGGPPAAAT
jgi:hypothetical protein